MLSKTELVTNLNHQYNLLKIQMSVGIDNDKETAPINIKVYHN